MTRDRTNAGPFEAAVRHGGSALRILHVDDEPTVLAIFRSALLAAGFYVDSVLDLDQAAELTARRAPYDIVLIDWRPPGTSDRLGFARWFRDRFPSTGIVMTSVVSDPEVQRAALENVCDDYIVKPCAPAVLIGRLRAIARRSSYALIATWGPLRVEQATNRVWARGREVHGLQPLQVRLLSFLIRRAGQPCSNDEIRREVFVVGAHHRTSIPRAISVLRAALGEVGEEIRTVPGGYGVGVAGRLPSRRGA